MNRAVLLPSLLALAVADAAGAIDLYVREKYVDASGEKCGSCDPEGGGCHLSRRAIFLGGECYNRADDRASLYGQLADSTVCRQEIDVSCDADVPPGFDPDAEAAECRDSWELGVCEDSESMRRLEGWCVRSEAPVDDFTVPLLQFRHYRGDRRCGSDDYVTLLLPDEGWACVPLSFESGGAYVKGSRRVGCEGDTFRAARYESVDCSGEGLGTRVDGSSGQCPEGAAGGAYTNDCGAPRIYCRAAPELGGELGAMVAAAGKEAGYDEGGAGAATAVKVSDGAGASATSGGKARASSIGLVIVAVAMTLPWIRR